MSNKPNIGIDLMGCDTPAASLIQGLLPQLPSSLQFTFFVTEDLASLIPPPFCSSVAQEVIEMQDNPLYALRKKKHTTMEKGICMLQEGGIDAFISAGNTGALVLFAKKHLSLLPSIDRPALMTLLPTKENMMAVIDVGAHVHSSAQELVHYALMGSSFQKCRGLKTPRVGLLNMGTEEKKGTATLQEAYSLLSKETRISFHGNIEGRDVFLGNIDVLVTDGLLGNVFLKTSEGIATVFLEGLHMVAKEECSPTLKAALATLRQKLFFAEYPGALLMGLNKIVLKCHGNSTPLSFLSSIEEAISLLKGNFIKTFSSYLKSAIIQPN